MREIKFRAWNETKNEWYYQDDLIITSYGIFEGYHTLSENKPIKSPLLMQYTGLTDKNGREIYESDIVRIWEETEHIPNRDSGGGIIEYDQREGYSQLGIVEFKNAWFTYETKKHLKGRVENIYAPLDFTNNLEVVGNIYENKELIV